MIVIAFYVICVYLHCPLPSYFPNWEMSMTWIKPDSITTIQVDIFNLFNSFCLKEVHVEQCVIVKQGRETTGQIAF